ncbi:hypothetical protein EKTHUN627_30910 [Enterobacter kobei]|nr:hypothetical protein EKTHUN627_30910 [Enterobacter kobei]
MFSKLAYSTLALTVSLGTVMSCQAEVTGTSFTAAFDHPQQINAGDLNEWKGLPLDMRLINFRAIIG